MIVLLACASTANAIQDAPPNPDAPIVADFLDRVKRYEALHNKLESTLPTVPTAATTEIPAIAAF